MNPMSEIPVHTEDGVSTVSFNRLALPYHQGD